MALLYQISIPIKIKRQERLFAHTAKYGSAEDTPETLKVKDFESHEIEAGKYGPVKLGMTREEFEDAVELKTYFFKAPLENLHYEFEHKDAIAGLAKYGHIGPAFVFRPDKNDEMRIVKILPSRPF